MTLSAPERIPALDGARGLAILLVLAHNFDVITPATPISAAVDFLSNLGWIGVQLFFVLSGFLITRNLLVTRDSPHYWRNFIVRRSLRIFPIYYLTLLIVFVIVPLVGKPAAGHEHQIWLWTYLVNWTEPAGAGVPIFPHFWSLAIEEQFYLIWPAVVLLCPPRKLAAVCALICVIALLSRAYLVYGTHNVAGAYMYSSSRMDALAFGALAAIAITIAPYREYMKTVAERLPTAVVLLLTVTVLATRGAPRTGQLTQIYGYSLFALAFALLVVNLVVRDDRIAKVLSLTPLRAMGRYSYAMYLFHLPLHLLLGLKLLQKLDIEQPTLPEALAYEFVVTVVTFVCGWISFELIERHFLKLKPVLAPEPTKAIA